MRIETRAEMADRLAIENALRMQRDTDTQRNKILTADALLGMEGVEHVTVWTDVHGRPKHSSRVERLS